jgi:hypothetical protein
MVRITTTAMIATAAMPRTIMSVELFVEFTLGS